METLADGLMSKGHDVHLLTADNSTYQGKAKCHTIPHLKRSLSIFSDIRALFEIRKYLRDLKPDLVSVHSTKAAYLGRFARLGCSVPCVYTVHGLAYITTAKQPLRTLTQWLESFMALITHHYIFLSQKDINVLQHEPRNYSIIPNGVPDPSLREEKAENLPVEFRLLWVGRLAPPKDPFTLIRELKELESFPWQLSVVGEGPYREQAEQLAKKLGIYDRITFYGEVPEPGGMYANCDVVILLSHAEGQPLVLLEAMSFKKVVVASRVGSVEEMVEHNQTGFIVDGQIGPTLRYLFEHPEVMKEMGEAGYKRFRRMFTSGLMITRTEQLFTKLVDEYR